ncbi:MAG: signal peptidase I [Pseudomonadota bacterium]
MVRALQILAGAILVSFIAYFSVWCVGSSIGGDLEPLLLAATALSGVYWLAERLVFGPRRRQLADMLVDALPDGQGDREACRAIVMERPWWLAWAGVFPIAAILLVLHSFLLAPFKMPSSAMSPTLRVGDLIMVSKYAYGLQLPLFGTRVGAGTPPQRGDVIVFRYPLRPTEDRVRRVVGLPGEEVAYLNKRLRINGRPVPARYTGDFVSKRAGRVFKQFEEQLDGHSHRVIHEDRRSGRVRGAGEFAFKENCSYPAEGIVCRVPEGHYFTLGDNRDNAADSRFWGFVPQQEIIGKALFVWMNFEYPDQIGQIR